MCLTHIIKSYNYGRSIQQGAISPTQNPCFPSTLITLNTLLLNKQKQSNSYFKIYKNDCFTQSRKL